MGNLKVKWCVGVRLMPDELYCIISDRDRSLGVVMRPISGLVSGKLPGSVVASATVGGVVAQRSRMAVHMPLAKMRRTVT